MSFRSPWQSLSQDARNSLIAAAAVTAFFLFALLLAWLLQSMEFPSWTPTALLVFILLQAVVQASFSWRRWRRAKSGR